MSKIQQALLSLAIRCAVIAAVAVVNYLITAFSSGVITLPLPVVTIPTVGLLLSEADTWLVNWEKSNNVITQ
jgi:hypothetical protein